MAETIVMPQAGNSVESCIVLSWRISEGDTVAVGDIVCEIETDKATMEVEATAAGTVLRVLAEEGDEVPVKDPLVIVGEPGESVEAAGSGTAKGGTEGGAEDSSAGTNDSPGDRAAAGAVPSGAQPTEAKRAADDRNLVRSSMTGKVRVSPRARNRATTIGIDPTVLEGSGPGGRVLERDVLAAAETGVGQVQASASSQGVAGGGAVQSGSAINGAYEDVTVGGVRKTIAQRMLASLQESAQLTLQRRADARSVLAYRARVKDERKRLGPDGDTGGGKDSLPNITINDMIMFAVSRVLPDYPDMNAHFLGSTIRRFSGADIGFAVDTPKGLLVPTIARADAKSLAVIARDGRGLAERALAGRASSEDLAPATFTVTNLGGLGIEWFTPVLNTPQVGILGVGTIFQGHADNGEVVPQIGLSLTIDHRAVDGAPAARFLADVAQSIATFELTLAK